MESARRNRWIRWTLVFGGLAAVVWGLGQARLGSLLLGALTALRELGPAGMVPFAATYALATLLLLPSTPFPLAAGFLYGPWVGFGVAMFGELAGALLAWHAGRTFLRERARALVDRSPVLAAVGDAVQEGGFGLLVLVRLSPVIPFGPLNYSLGLFDVSPRRFLWPTMLGVSPACLFLTWTGAALPHLQAVLEGEEGLGNAWFYWAGLVATGLAIVAVTHSTRRALARRMERLQASGADPGAGSPGST